MLSVVLRKQGTPVKKEMYGPSMATPQIILAGG